MEYGEEYFMKISKVKCDCKNMTLLKIFPIDGELIMTNYKIVFKY